MLTPLASIIAVERMRANIEAPHPDAEPRRRRRLIAAGLRRLADRLQAAHD